MPDLTKTLQGNDLGFLKMVANTWGLELEQPDAATALPVLVRALRNGSLIHEVLDVLPPEGIEALQTLMENEGKMPWAEFCRRFGEVRLMGAARRDRERPDLKPSSISEVLWYRALIGKAFLNIPPEPQEFVYIPEDLQEFLQYLAPAASPPLGRPASPVEAVEIYPATDLILDHACTFLAARRIGMVDVPGSESWGIPIKFLESLLCSAGLIDTDGQLQPESVRQFLEAPRSEALRKLAKAWQESPTLNDLRLLLDLVFDGNWDNQPLPARQVILEMLSHLPQDRWWNLATLISAVKEQRPDFQRPGGDYDSWFIRKNDSKEYLRGFENWDEVDGQLLRWIVTGPLHWLGWYDLAAPDSTSLPAAFRPSAWSYALWQNQAPAGLQEEKAQVRVTSEGLLRVPSLAPRSVRYQLARFCEWLGEKDREYLFRLSPASLEHARQQGLRSTHLVTLLRRYASTPLPPTLFKAIDRWEKFGAQVSVEPAVLLRVASPEILTALRSSRAARFLGENLSSTVVTILPGSQEKIRQILMEIGYLTEGHV